MSDETYLTPVEELKNTDLDFNRFKEIYDRDAEDTQEKLITFILTQAQTYKNELESDVSTTLPLRHSIITWCVACRSQPGWDQDEWTARGSQQENCHHEGKVRLSKLA